MRTCDLLSFNTLHTVALLFPLLCTVMPFRQATAELRAIAEAFKARAKGALSVQEVRKRYHLITAAVHALQGMAQRSSKCTASEGRVSRAVRVQRLSKALAKAKRTLRKAKARVARTKKALAVAFTSYIDRVPRDLRVVERKLNIAQGKALKARGQAQLVGAGVRRGRRGVAAKAAAKSVAAAAKSAQVARRLRKQFGLDVFYADVKEARVSRNAAVAALVKVRVTVAKLNKKLARMGRTNRAVRLRHKARKQVAKAARTGKKAPARKGKKAFKKLSRKSKKCVALRRRFRKAKRSARRMTTKVNRAKHYAKRTKRAARRAQKAIAQAKAKRSNPVFVAKQRKAKAVVAKKQVASNKSMNKVKAAFRKLIKGMPAKQVKLETKAHKAWLASQRAQAKLAV